MEIEHQTQGQLFIKPFNTLDAVAFIHHRKVFGKEILGIFKIFGVVGFKHRAAERLVKYFIFQIIRAGIVGFIPEKVCSYEVLFAPAENISFRDFFYRFIAK